MGISKIVCNKLYSAVVVNDNYVSPPPSTSFFHVSCCTRLICALLGQLLLAPKCSPKSQTLGEK